LADQDEMEQMEPVDDMEMQVQQDHMVQLANLDLMESQGKLDWQDQKDP